MAKDEFKPRRFRDSSGHPTIQIAPCTFVRDHEPLPDSGYCENCGSDVSGRDAKSARIISDQNRLIQSLREQLFQRESCLRVLRRSLATRVFGSKND